MIAEICGVSSTQRPISLHFVKIVLFLVPILATCTFTGSSWLLWPARGVLPDSVSLASLRCSVR